MKKYFIVILTSFLVIISFQYFSMKHAMYSRAEIVHEDHESYEAKLQERKDRDEYFFTTFRDPWSNSIPNNIRAMELAKVDNIDKAENVLFKGSLISSIAWKEAGPFNVGGRTRAVVIDIDNSSTIIVGAVSGGIWKSTDKGSTWKMKSRTNQILSVTSITQDPRPGYRSNLFYVGGEYRGNSASETGANFYGAGLYKSTDKGETWNLVPNNLNHPSGRSFNSELSYASKIIVHPLTGYLFLCSNASGILRSTDYGTTWGNETNKFSLGGTNNHYYSDIAVSKNGLLVATLSQSAPTSSPINPPGIYKSSDNGNSWINITPNSFPTTHARSVIANVPSNPNWFYVFTYTNKTNSSNSREIQSLFKINATSGEFLDLTSNLPDITGNSLGYLNTQGNYNMAIAVHPTNENIVLIAGTNMFRSFDGFATKVTNSKNGWIGGYNQSYFNPTSLHPDIHTIVFDENNPNEVWVGHDGGLSFTPDITNTSYTQYFPWENRDLGYAVTQFYTAAQSSKKNDYRIAGGTQDNGTPSFQFDGLISTNSSDATGGDGAYCYFGNNYFYGSTQNGNVTRYDYGSSGQIDRSNWAIVTPDSSSGQLFIHPFAVDPSNENYMYYLGGNVLWRNKALESIPQYNNKKTLIGWERIKNLIPSNYKFVSLAISKTNPSGQLYLGAYSYVGQPKIFRMENSYSFTEASEITPPYSSNASGEVPNGTYPYSIAVNPQNGNELIVVFSNYNVRSIWYSSNGGATWSDIEGNLSGYDGPSVRASAILPTSEGTIYLVGTSTGLFSTTVLDGANTTWIQQGSDVIGNVVIDFLSARDSDGRIIVGTHGRGIFVGTSTVTSVETELQIPTSIILEQNYPNPFNPETVIRYQLSVDSKVSLKIYDLLGKEVATLVDGYKKAGSYNCEWRIDNGELSSGVYIYRLTVDKNSLTKKMIFLK